MFTFAPSLLKQNIGVFQSGTSLPSTFRKTVLVTTSLVTRGFFVPETLASMPINVTGLGVRKVTSGSSVPVSLVQTKSLSQGWESPSPITTVPATEINSFGGVVTPVNVLSYIRPYPIILKGNLAINYLSN